MDRTPTDGDFSLEQLADAMRDLNEHRPDWLLTAEEILVYPEFQAFHEPAAGETD